MPRLVASRSDPWMRYFQEVPKRRVLYTNVSLVKREKQSLLSIRHSRAIKHDCCAIFRFVDRQGQRLAPDFGRAFEPQYLLVTSFHGTTNPEDAMYGLIRSRISQRRVFLVDVKDTLHQPVSQYPCSQQKWQDAYAERVRNPESTVYGRYCAGTVDLFRDEQVQVSCICRARGANVRTYNAEASDNDKQPGGDDGHTTDIVETVADAPADETTCFDRCKISHSWFYSKSPFSETDDIAHSTPYRDHSDINHSVVGLYERTAEDETGHLEFCCSDDRVVEFFYTAGPSAVMCRSRSLHPDVSWVQQLASAHSEIRRNSSLTGSHLDSGMRQLVVLTGEKQKTFDNELSCTSTQTRPL
nr:hypothetical protein CFP56_60299 [Quercus suber]